MNLNYILIVLLAFLISLMLFSESQRAKNKPDIF